MVVNANVCTSLISAHILGKVIGVWDLRLRLNWTLFPKGNPVFYRIMMIIIIIIIMIIIIVIIITVTMNKLFGPFLTEIWQAPLKKFHWLQSHKWKIIFNAFLSIMLIYISTTWRNDYWLYGWNMVCTLDAHSACTKKLLLLLAAISNTLQQF